MNSKRRRYNPEFYIENILAGDKIVLSRAITVIESHHLEDERLASEILNKILPYTGKSKRIGLTGSPGAGKSTFIESFGKSILSSGNNRIAVLTIDPSSSKTQGSILGDKTRMTELSKDERVFIRPTAAGKNLGGVSSKTREVMLLCEAAGYNIILIETVGVGQSETLVKGMVDFFLLLTISGGGDELQGIKRGIMEMADMLIVNKADGDNLERAKRTRQDYENALHVLKSDSSIPSVWICSALSGFNIKESWEKINSTIDSMIMDGSFLRNRNQQNLDWMHELIRTKLQEALYLNPSMKELIMNIEKEVLVGKKEASYAANILLDQFWKSCYK